jgi:hypothetical protein
MSAPRRLTAPPNPPSAGGSARRPQTRINGIIYEYPICHRCGIPVRAFTWGDFSDAEYAGELSRAFFALCHGETDTIVIPLSVLAQGVGICIGEAFVDPQLPPPHADSELKRMPPYRALPSGSPSPAGLPLPSSRGGRRVLT